MNLRKDTGGIVEAGAAWLYDHGADGFAIARDGLLLSVNPAWCAITGSRPSQAIGLSVDQQVHPDDRPALHAATARLDAEDEILLDHRMITAGGATIWVRASVRRSVDGSDMIVIRNITAERAQREEADSAVRANELLRAAAGVVTWSFHPDTKRYAFDWDFDSEGGDGPVGARDMSVDEMTAAIHPEDQADFAKVFFPSLQTGEPGQFWYRHLRGDGRWARFRAEWRGVRCASDGNWRILGLTQDMTELADARDAALLGERAAREASEIKSQFLANISHEIRTPLNGVLGVLHLLKDEALSARGRSRLAEALNCGSALTEMLNDVLDFSRIEARALDLAREPVDVAAVVTEVADLMRVQVEAKGLALETEIDLAAGWIQADPVRLCQAMFNLIGNAVKFTDRGAIAIRLKTAGASAARRLRLEIADTGIGMSAAAQAGLFDRFHQADGSVTRRFGGAGLGLAITRALVDLMGGEVGVESLEGKGSTFWIDIPAPEIAAPEAADAEGGWLEGLRVLVVEDNPTNRLVATGMLETLGARVETAENGALGVEAVRRSAFDLVFMDIQMPVMDGIAAAKAIRALPAPSGETPIVAMTANAMAHQRADYDRAGMNGLVAKPISPAAIVAEIARLASGGKAETAAAA